MGPSDLAILTRQSPRPLNSRPSPFPTSAARRVLQFSSFTFYPRILKHLENILSPSEVQRVDEAERRGSCRTTRGQVANEELEFLFRYFFRFSFFYFSWNDRVLSFKRAVSLPLSSPFSYILSLFSLFLITNKNAVMQKFCTFSLIFSLPARTDSSCQLRPRTASWKCPWRRSWVPAWGSNGSHWPSYHATERWSPKNDFF